MIYRPQYFVTYGFKHSYAHYHHILLRFFRYMPIVQITEVFWYMDNCTNNGNMRRKLMLNLAQICCLSRQLYDPIPYFDIFITWFVRVNMHYHQSVCADVVQCYAEFCRHFFLHFHQSPSICICSPFISVIEAYKIWHIIKCYIYDIDYGLLLMFNMLWYTGWPKKVSNHHLIKLKNLF